MNNNFWSNCYWKGTLLPSWFGSGTLIWIELDMSWTKLDKIMYIVIAVKYNE